MKCIVIRMKMADMSLWNTMLQGGVELQVQTGLSVAAILEGRLGMDAEYIEEVVRTVFVNGSPVDDIGSTPVEDGDVLALAGAMPGLVGIAMGRQSPVGAFRGDISCKTGKVSETGEIGIITLKAFNVVAQTSGASILEYGIIVPGADLATYMIDRKRVLTDSVRSIVAGSDEFTFDGLMAELAGKQARVSLQVLVN